MSEITKPDFDELDPIEAENARLEQEWEDSLFWCDVNVVTPEGEELKRIQITPQLTVVKNETGQPVPLEVLMLADLVFQAKGINERAKAKEAKEAALQTEVRTEGFE